MRMVRFFFLFLATAIVLLHSVVEHHHHSDLSSAEHAEEHKQVNNIFAFLAIGFHHDNGEGHLEEMTASDALEVDLDLNLLPCAHFSISDNCPVLISDAHQVGHAAAVPLPKDRLSTSLVLRGPPMLS